MCLMTLCGTAVAQKNVKLGHINYAELVQIMPGIDTVQSVLERETTELEAQYKSMMGEYEKKVNDYTEKQAEMVKIVREAKEKEIMQLRARIEEFQQSAQTQLQTRQSELMQPVIDRAKKAVEEVAKENSYTYILDASALVYYQDSDDIMALVKKRLGISK